MNTSDGFRSPEGRVCNRFRGRLSSPQDGRTGRANILRARAACLRTTLSRRLSLSQSQRASSAAGLPVHGRYLPRIFLSLSQPKLRPAKQGNRLPAPRGSRVGSCAGARGRRRPRLDFGLRGLGTGAAGLRRRPPAESKPSFPAPPGPRCLYLSMKKLCCSSDHSLLLRHHHGQILAGAPGQKDAAAWRPGRIFPPRRRATGAGAKARSCRLPRPPPGGSSGKGLTARPRLPGPSQAPRRPQAQLCVRTVVNTSSPETMCVGTRVRKNRL